MIFVLHGDDIDSSYQRLRQIIGNYPEHIVARLDSPFTKEQLIQNIFGQYLFEDRIIIFENYFTFQKKIETDFLDNIAAGQIIIFHETSQLPNTKIVKFPKQWHVENFKVKQQIFTLLDNFLPNSKILLSLLVKIDSDNGLIWQLQHRFFLMILAKLGTSLDKAAAISREKIADWQWNKISSQARKFDMRILLKINSAILKIDYLAKSGQTDLNQRTLITFIILKYL